ncbi:MAG: DNA polymerase III subunit gamma/tau [Bacteroidetes bacterium]|nr:DNA polymerase III subunit gamma/tau [Bacteroidota bacterium]
MENFVVSARKYRPSTFDTVVGQSSITTTLKNAIKNNHLAQAFLFCGPRGVGKTTCARILAKTINCFTKTAAVEACDECESCKSFNSGHSLNVYELDAASNNSVDDIRNLVDQVRLAPQLGTHKVYIIDEVHMLSQAAFNAFLKTLEEPPKHAIFILATTEKHKIIPTILSRCQIFDFKRIQVDDISKHLESIAQKEGITAEPEALHIIAQKADGGLRDALSIFDQIVSFAGNNVKYQAVIENLNVLDYDYYFKAIDFALANDISGNLLLLNEVIGKGFDGHQFIVGLGEHVRNILVGKDPQTIQLLEVVGSIREKYQQQSAKCDVPSLIRWLGVINKTELSYKSSKNARLQLELCLIQLSTVSNSKVEIAPQDNAATVVVAKPAAAVVPVQQAAPPLQKTEPPAVSPTPPVVSATPTPQPASILEKKSILKTPSISQFMGGAKKDTKQEVETKEPSTQNLPTTNFTEEQMQAAWADFTKIQQQSGKVNLYTTLASQKPLLKENYQLEFSVENKVQEDVLDEIRLDLLEFLRKKLNNYSLSLQVVVKRDLSEKKAYTSSDRFKKMAEKNPLINKLKQQFDLEVDF